MVEKNLDLRSDTVTWPSPEMRQAAANAKVGDMGYGEDPTVNELESLAAERFGKEAAIFVTSGSQGNAVSILAQTNKGDEIILESRSHIYTMEKGHWAVIGSLIPRVVIGEQGFILPETIQQSVRGKVGDDMRTSLLCLENTHLASGGTPVTVDQMKKMYETGKEYNLQVHTDGARIFNASIALGVDVKDFARYSDTIQVCLSKGLAAPVGSLIVGSQEIIDTAKTYRRLLGGSMRQAGIIAAPGIVALTTMVDRLKIDHENAAYLGEGLKKLGFTLCYPVKTNMVFVDLTSMGWTPQEWVNACRISGFKTRVRDSRRLRLVTHYGIEKEDIKHLLSGISKLIK
jgi:threonine aldolase